jgi:hypothetical protein
MIFFVKGNERQKKKCPATRTGQYPWSPELDRAGNRFLYWKLRLREYTSRKINTVTLNKVG